MKRNYTKHEMAMLQLIQDEVVTLVGSYENLMMDVPEEDGEYKKAFDYLYHTPAEELLDEFYWMVMNRCKAGSYAEHARFAGSRFLRAQLIVFITTNKLGKEFSNK